jgi:ParB-like chromosome segregation protein Spo0J
VAQIAASIREFGFTNPILTDGSGGIIAGHGRVLAAQLLGLAEVPCIDLPHLTEAQRRAYIIADNKLALNAGWDEDLLRLELADLKALEIDLDLTAFGPGELDDILLGRDIEQKEFDESAADDVQFMTCPKCGNSFPK